MLLTAAYIALSTTKVEYVVLSTAAQEAIWLHQLMSDFINKNMQEMIIHEDNQSIMFGKKYRRFMEEPNILT